MSFGWKTVIITHVLKHYFMWSGNGVLVGAIMKEIGPSFDIF
jgi:hypothetical protein